MTSSTRTLAQALISADAAYKVGKFAEAERICEKIIAAKSDFFEAIHLSAIVQAAQGSNERALASYERALAIRPNHAEALNNRGVTLLQTKRFDEALGSFDRALSQNPNVAEFHNNRGLALHKLRRHGEALEAYDHALLIQRNYVDAFNNRGITLYELRQFSEALASYDRAISMQPNYVEALFNRGNALKELNRLDEALASYERALAVRPNHAEALINRGVTLHELNRMEDALSSYERALSARPGHVDALYNRGITLQALKRFDEAVASYESALSVRPGHAEALNNLGGILTDLGRPREGRGYFEKAIGLSPGNPKLYFGLARSKTFAVGDPSLAAMRELAEDIGGLSSEQQIYLHFALGKALADVENEEQSFHHLLQGNALKRRQVVYSEASMLDHLQRIERVFSPELMRNKSRKGDPSDVSIFIVGMPRSGSTLVEQILASHPEVFGAGETHHFATAMNALFPPTQFPEAIMAVADDELRQIGARYIDATTNLAPEAKKITDKMLANFRYVGLIHLTLPQARIIHTRRDPVDTCLSCFATLFTASQPFSYNLGELGRFYRAYQILMEHWRNVLPDHVLLEVQYEDVVDDLEGQARRLVAHCGLEWHRACLSYYDTQRPIQTASAIQVRQPIYRSSMRRWRPSDGLLSPLLAGLGIGAG